MATAFFKSTFRQLRKNSLHSVINIIGLSTGITTMLLAILFWRHEASYDKFHHNRENIYRITTSLKETKESEWQTVGATGQVQGPAFKEAIPQLSSFTRVMGGDIFSDLAANDKTLHLRPLYVDSNFLDVFTFPLVQGSPSVALSQPGYVVLTESAAIKLFSTTDVLGKIITSEADPSAEKVGTQLTISAVVKDPPENSSLQFDVLFPFSYMELAFTDDSWLNAYLGTFVEIEPGANTEKVSSLFNEIYNVRGREQLTRNIQQYGFDPQIKYGLQPLSDVHLHPLQRSTGNIESGVINGSTPFYSIAFLVLAGFILLMASVNFVNISVAGSLRRAKEVGVRKISGGSSMQIILQFLSESAILCAFSFLIGICAMIILLPVFNDVSGKHLVLADVTNSSVPLYFLMLLVLIVGTTGLYPAFLLSRFEPAEVLYNRIFHPGESRTGKMLIIMQFTPAIILLIAAIVYFRQMDFIRTKDPGYNPDYIIRSAVYGDRDYRTAVSFMQNELSKEPLIKSVSFGNSGQNFFVDINQRSFDVIHKTIDQQFIPLMEIPIVAGSNLPPGEAARNVALVNESFVRAAGLADPLGATVSLGEYYENKKLKIIGIVKDHHFLSPKVRIAPMIFFGRRNEDAEMWVKIDKENVPGAIAAFEKVYKAAMPGAVFQYNFLDDLNAREFKNEQRWQKIIGSATVVAIVICALGLFGLAHLSARQRIKEIGIRKVLGASVSNVVMLMTSRFMKPVLISFVIAGPIAWMLINRWLMNFAYRIEFGPGIFASAAILTVCIAIIAVIGQSLKSAQQNVIDAIRKE